ncbi:trypsin 5G1-like [Ctenocephalides felis]|uniref:trypsin 5G1-like n=1 Tax=Ctenocephalides felis TaxID=7515 RepID=UPI000E6E1545|nr:trypsin 5G1-like [Ctenocephalides felis]
MLLSLIFAAFAAVAVAGHDLDHRIVGGEDVDISTCGWQVSFHNKNGHFCGGSIIGKEWILTAAHCVTKYENNIEGLKVRVGSNVHNKGGRLYDIIEIKKHPRYSDRTKYDFDVALLRIAKPIAYTACTVVPVTLAETGKEVPEGALVSVTGWGATMIGGPGSTQLKAVKVPIVSNEECNKNYTIPGSLKDNISDSMFCAGFPEGGKDSCQGDSGGPVVDENRVQVGIVSWGEGCALAGKPGVYAKVSHPDVKRFIETVAGIK